MEVAIIQAVNMDAFGKDMSALVLSFTPQEVLNAVEATSLDIRTTPLMAVCFHALGLDYMKPLVACGADPNITTSRGWTALDMMRKLPKDGRDAYAEYPGVLSYLESITDERVQDGIVDANAIAANLIGG